MTNKEIAQLIVGAHNVEFAERCIVEVTEALNEAEKRGLKQGREEHKAGCTIAFQRGAEQMRERAANRIKDRNFGTDRESNAEGIRSLPLGGE